MRGLVADGDLDEDSSAAFSPPSPFFPSLLRDLRFAYLLLDALLCFPSMLRDVLLRFLSLLRDLLQWVARLFLLARSRLPERLLLPLLFSPLTLRLRLPATRPPLRLLSALSDRFLTSSRFRLLERLFLATIVSRLRDLSLRASLFSRLGDLFFRSFLDLSRSFLTSFRSEDELDLFFDALRSPL